MYKEARRSYKIKILTFVVCRMMEDNGVEIRRIEDQNQGYLNIE
jgi:hypothetical protein